MRPTLNWVTKFRRSLTLLPVGGVKPSDLRELRTVPLCFSPAPSQSVRLVRHLYKLLFLGRRVPKQAFRCQEIRISSPIASDTTAKKRLCVGDNICIRLAVGESGTHFLRSASRSSAGRELLLAVVLPKKRGDSFKKRARCIWVRHPARLISDPAGGSLCTILDCQVITPSAVGIASETRQKHSKVPRDAVWLYLDEGVQVRQSIVQKHDTSRFPGERICYAYGASRPRGFVAFVAKISAIVVIVTLIMNNVPLMDTAVLYFPVLGVLAIVLLVSLLVYLARRATPEWLRRRCPRVFGVESPAVMVEPRFRHRLAEPVKQELLWHGSSRRALAIGDHHRGVAAW